MQQYISDFKFFGCLQVNIIPTINHFYPVSSTTGHLLIIFYVQFEIGISFDITVHTFMLIIVISYIF